MRKREREVGQVRAGKVPLVFTPTSPPLGPSYIRTLVMIALEGSQEIRL